MLTQLLKEERARERNGIARPAFSKPWFKQGWFSWKLRGPALVVAGSGLAAALVALIVHVR